MEQDYIFLEYVIKALVDHPEDIKIVRTVDEMGVLLTLTVHRDDMGKVIGRAGQTAKAIRTILRVVGMKYDARVNLKINEPEGGMRDPSVAGSSAHTPSAPARAPREKSVDEALADLES